MLFVSQHDFPGGCFSIQSDLKSEQPSYESIERSGCGICAMMMAIEQLKSHSMQIQDAVRIAEECGSTERGFVDMNIYGKACAEKFGLKMDVSIDVEYVEECLDAGGCVIVNVKGDYEGFRGLFSHHGHYMTIISHDENEFCLLDPGFDKEWYESPERKCKVRTVGYFLYVSPEILMNNLQTENSGFFCFRRK